MYAAKRLSMATTRLSETRLFTVSKLNANAPLPRAGAFGLAPSESATAALPARCAPALSEVAFAATAAAATCVGALSSTPTASTCRVRVAGVAVDERQHPQRRHQHMQPQQPPVTVSPSTCSTRT